ncbi:MAG TPA: DUF2157 domain-containing protein [Candidatus Sulfotelmatobacter sp.]
MATSDQLEQQLQRWTDAGILDSESAGRIRDFESTHESPGVRWPVIFAIAFGSIMVAAGVLLFVAAHWDDLSPAQRFLLVVAMIAGFHLAAGALMPRLRPLGLALHAIGTVALGSGIYLAGQIFNLQEHWPGGILLWAMGAVLSWLVLHDWLQATLSALLVPAWIASEWSVRAGHFSDMERLLFQFLVLLSITYLSARRPGADSYFRRALVWVGGLGVLPICAALAMLREPFFGRTSLPLPFSLNAAGLLMAFAIPLLAAYFLRGKSAVWNMGYAVWVYVIGRLDDRNLFENVSLHFLCALASVGLVLWGLQENRRERINVGVAAFAFTIMAFYFSNVMGKLDRSAALIGFGVLFLLGGWQLEQLRRKLVARTRTGPTATGGVA